MSNATQKRALSTYRHRLRQKGLARFEVLGLDGDRDLIRSLAKRLAQDDSAAERLQAEIRRSLTGRPSKTGDIVTALRQSPLVGAEDLDITRDSILDRDLER